LSIAMAECGRLLRFSRRWLTRPDRVRLSSVELRLPHACTGRMRRSLYAERYERHEAEAVRRCVRAGDVVVEAGACIGYLGLVAARIVGPGNLTLVEANGLLPAWIEANFRANDMVPPRIIHGLVCGPGPPARPFNVSGDLWSSSMMSRDGTSRVEQVACVDIDALLAETGASVLVCDIEGAEAELIRGCEFPQLRVLIMEFHPSRWPDLDVAGARAALARRGFRPAGVFGGEVFVFCRPPPEAAVPEG